MRDRYAAGTVRNVVFEEREAQSREGIRQRPRWPLDALLATPFVITLLLTTRQGGPSPEPPDAFVIALILATTVPYYARRLAPVPVLVVSMSAAAALFIAGYNPGPVPFLIAIGTYTVGAYRPLREVVTAALFQNGCLVVMLVADSPHFAVPEFITSVPVYAATMLVGWSMQQRRLHYESLVRERDQSRLRAAADERLRIAQELHDVIGHSLGVIAVQSGVGLHLIDTDPDEAKRALEHISRTSRSSLAEIRRLLGLVRMGEGMTYAPTPGLADLRRLADEVTQSGMPVSLSLADGARELPPGVELAAYRIVQEALTNARKHAGARKVSVEIDVDGGALKVVVTDDGRGDPSTVFNGHGLIGMRERVAVYGGSLDAGPAPDGGFRVRALLPYEELS